MQYNFNSIKSTLTNINWKELDMFKAQIYTRRPRFGIDSQW